MTTRATAPIGHSRRDQLTSALVVGGVVVVLGAASGLGIAVTSIASAAPTQSAQRAIGASPSAGHSSSAPPNYIGVPGPGTVPTGASTLGVAPGQATPTVPATTSTTGTTSSGASGAPSTSFTTSPNSAPGSPTLQCPSDVVTGLLDVLLGNKGLLSADSGLLKTVLHILPDLATLLTRLPNAPSLHTDVAQMSIPEITTMAQSCTPVLAGLLGGTTG